MASAPLRSYFQARVNYTTAIYGTCVKPKVFFTRESDENFLCETTNKVFIPRIRNKLWSLPKDLWSKWTE